MASPKAYSIQIAVSILVGCVAGAAALDAAMFAGRWHLLAWVGLAPYAFLLRPSTPPVLAYAAAFVGTATFHLLGLWFLCACLDGLFAPVWFLATIGGALCAVAVFAVGRQFTRVTGWPAVVALPVVWVAYEYVRYLAFGASLGDGFTLLWLGQALVFDDHLLQSADLGGVALLTALVAVVNGALFDLLGTLLHRRDGWIVSAARPVMAGALVLAVSWLYGALRLAQTLEDPGPVVALITGKPSGEPGVSRSALRRALVVIGGEQPAERATVGQAAIDLWVWPEVAFDGEIVTRRSQINHSIELACSDTGGARLWKISRSLGTPILTGTWRVEEPAGGAVPDCFNSLAYVTPDRGLIGLYDKRHLVPFLESLPQWAGLADSFGPQVVLAPEATRRRLRRGVSGAPFFLIDRRGRSFLVGPLVCYDVCFSDVHRSFMGPGRTVRPDLFVCVMQESFDSTGTASRITMMHTRLRAVEFRRPHFRVSNGGTSALVDSCGRVRAALDDSLKERPVVVGQMPGDRRVTLYSLLGDWFPIVCSAVVVGIGAVSGVRKMVAAVVRWIRRPTTEGHRPW